MGDEPRNMPKEIYLDHAATTPVDSKVREVMLPFWKEKYGNPSSIYKKGQEAKVAIEKSRSKIASILNCKPQEVIFTGSGTESCNLAILGTARAHKDQGCHIITSKIEHHAVLHSCQHLEKEGFKVTYLDVNKNGLVDPKEVKNSLTEDTILVTIMYANNEIGTIQPIAEIADIIKKSKVNGQGSLNQSTAEPEQSTVHGKEHGSGQAGVLFHTDACQAAGYLDLDVKKLGVDLMTINGSKIYAPKGVGALYKKREVKLEPLMYGGEQEFGLKPGTENVANFVGLGKALEIADVKKETEVKRLTKLRDYLTEKIKKEIPKVRFNGHPQKRLPNNVHFCFKGIEGEALLLWLDKNNIYASTGSACTSSQLEPSHVLEAIGLPREISHGSLRLTLGRSTTKKDLDYTVKVLKKTVKKLREISAV